MYTLKPDKIEKQTPLACEVKNKKAKSIVIILYKNVFDGLNFVLNTINTTKKRGNFLPLSWSAVEGTT